MHGAAGCLSLAVEGYSSAMWPVVQRSILMSVCFTSLACQLSLDLEQVGGAHAADAGQSADAASPHEPAGFERCLPERNVLTIPVLPRPPPPPDDELASLLGPLNPRVSAYYVERRENTFVVSMYTEPTPLEIELPFVPEGAHVFEARPGAPLDGDTRAGVRLWAYGHNIMYSAEGLLYLEPSDRGFSLRFCNMAFSRAIEGEMRGESFLAHAWIDID
jgi:hypothetical protein